MRTFHGCGGLLAAALALAACDDADGKANAADDKSGAAIKTGKDAATIEGRGVEIRANAGDADGSAAVRVNDGASVRAKDGSLNKVRVDANGVEVVTENAAGEKTEVTAKDGKTEIKSPDGKVKTGNGDVEIESAEGNVKIKDGKIEIDGKKIPGM